MKIRPSLFAYRLLITAPALAAFAGVVAVGGSVYAKDGEKDASARCRVYEIEASTSGDGTIPSDLQFMKDELGTPQFGAFKGFRTLKKLDLKLKLGQSEKASLSNYALELKFLNASASTLKLHATFRSKAGKTILNADYAIQNRGFILVPIVKKDRATIYAIRCQNA